MTAISHISEGRWGRLPNLAAGLEGRPRAKMKWFSAR
jgi:hypothetical protein